LDGVRADVLEALRRPCGEVAEVKAAEPLALAVGASGSLEGDLVAVVVVLVVLY